MLTYLQISAYNIGSNGKGGALMRKERGRIGRTVTFTHCEGVKMQDGAFVQFKFDLIGDYDASKATNAIRKRLRDQTITITHVEKDSEFYSMPIRLFVETAINHQKGLLS